MHRYRLYSLPVILALILITGCRREEEATKTVSASYVQYQVQYLEDRAGDIPTRMLPDKMEAYYSHRYIKTSIEGFFGMFSLVYIADLRKQNVTTLLNFIGNKIYYVGKRGDIPVGIHALQDPEITLTIDTSSYCGLLSKKAEIQTSVDTYNIYFTEELDIRSPNITTPYRFIDYVLTDFRVQLSLLKMRLIMDKYEDIMIDTSMFIVPEEYEEVTKEEMTAIINNLFTKES